MISRWCKNRIIRPLMSGNDVHSGLAAALAGTFLVFDGPDGSGKSTQFARFADWCREQGVVVCTVREPGGTSIGEQIREVLLNPDNTDMALRCEMLLYMASRAQLMEQMIAPALARREVVLADRFISSTLAYQGAAGGLPRADIDAVGDVVIRDHQPDLVVVFDVDDATRAQRLGGRRGAGSQPTLFSDRMERKADSFHQRVRAGYLEQVEQDPQGHLLIDAAACEDDVFAALLSGLGERLG